MSFERICARHLPLGSRCRSAAAPLVKDPDGQRDPPPREERCALEYLECAGDDLDGKGTTPFPRLARSKPGETVVFSWIVYKSRAHRDRVNAKVMADPRIAKMMGPDAMPFDPRRMAYGGFRAIVDL